MSPEGNRGEIERLKARVAELERLLESYEQAAASQAGRIDTPKEQVDAQAEAIHTIVQGIAATTAEGFFRSLVFHLASQLRVQHAFVGELVEGKNDRIRTLAVWAGEGFADNFEYDLAATPCANVVGQSLCYYKEGVQQLFPEDHLLAAMGVDSYCGIPLFDTTGRALGLLVVMHDRPVPPAVDPRNILTICATRASLELERKQTEELLRESQERFRQLAESIREVFWLSDPGKNRIVYISPGYEEVWGRTCDSLYASPRSWLDAIHPEDRGRVLEAALSKQIAGDYDEEYRIVRSDGAVRWIRDRAFPVHNQSGEVYRIAGIAEDITERKQAEESLQKTTRDLQTVIQASPLAIIALDTNGNVTSWNLTAERIFGWSEQEVLGHPLPYVPEGGRGESDVLWESVMRGQFLKGVELRRHRKDGSMVDLSFWAAPLHDRSGNVISTIGLLADITERKRLEEQLRQSQKMEAIGRLAGGVAHDFNNLLTVIIGQSERLLKSLTASDRHRKSAEGIKQAGERAASLTRQLLAFSRKQVIQPKLVDMNGVVSNMAVMLQRLIGEDIHLTAALEARPCPVKADPGQIEQVLMNLAVNARDAMSDGGTLTIGTSIAQGGASGRAELPPGSYVRLTVRDTGCGMDAETQAHLFEPFFTTKERGKGTGLGLATVYGIVAQSGGVVTVDSVLGKGTTFMIFLPHAEEGAPVEEMATEPTKETLNTETILLVEDDALVLEFVRDLLRGLGYRVFEAASGEQALRLCETSRETFHLLLTDVVIPGMSGRVLAERATVLRPMMKVLFMSGYTDDVVLRHGVLEAGTAFLNKPFLPEALTRKIREVLDAR